MHLHTAVLYAQKGTVETLHHVHNGRYQWIYCEPNCKIFNVRFCGSTDLTLSQFQKLMRRIRKGSKNQDCYDSAVETIQEIRKSGSFPEITRVNAILTDIYIVDIMTDFPHSLNGKGKRWYECFKPSWF